MSLTSDLEGRRALVTGAGQGVGRAIAHTLASAGATALVNDVRLDAAEAVVEEIRAAGGKAEALPFDVTDWQHVVAAAGSGEVDILVNNAGNAGVGGFARICNFAESNPEDWSRYFAVNLFGTMHCTRAVLPPMISAGWGRIITIVSDAGRFGDAKLAPYAAAKAGAAGFCRSVAREVGRHGITVNCVSLGTIVTPTTAKPQADTPEAKEAERAALRPYVVRRRGTPADVVGVVAYLASSMAEWVTGQTYPVNGGYTFAL
jgi:NAD(P)-dependent dehydrogenase (short-subunit alcohol dehydrogenase family)